MNGEIRKYPGWRLFAVFLAISALLGAFFNPTYDTAKDSSLARFSTAQALVEDGSFAIDNSFGLSTVDKVYISGHFYGCQTPLMPMLIAAAYYPLYQLGLTFGAHERLAVWILTLIFAGGCSAGAAVFAGRINLAITNDVWKSILLSVLFFLTTIYFSYSVVLNNHTFSGFLIIAAIYYILYTKPTALTGGISGLFLASAAVTDPPAGIAFGGAVFLYMIVRKTPIRVIMIFLLGGSIPGIIHSAANYTISGSIFPVNIKPEFFQYPGAVFDESNLSGVVSNSSLKEILIYSFNCLIGARGWFLYTPLLIFGVAGWRIALKSKDDEFRAWTVILPTLLVLGFYLWRTQNYGGHSYGVRFFLAITPPLFVGIAYLWRVIERKRWRGWFMAAGVWSFLIASIGLPRPLSNPQLSINSVAANIFEIQAQFFPETLRHTWKLQAKFAGGNPENIIHIGEWLERSGLLTEAEAAYELSLKMEENAPALQKLGTMYYFEQDFALALVYFRRAEADSADPKLWKKMGLCLAYLGELDLSNIYLENYIHTGDSTEAASPPALVRRHLVYYSQGDRDVALARISQNYSIIGNLETAYKYYNMTDPKFRWYQEIRTALANLYMREGKYAESKAVIMDIMQKSSKYYNALRTDPILAPAADEVYTELMNKRDQKSRKQK